LGQEIELKLELAAEAAAVFEQLALLPPDSATQTLHAVYFDTRKHQLRARGVSLRIRRSGKRRVQTVKVDDGGGAAAGLFSRVEWEMPVRGNQPVLDARTPILTMLGSAVDDIVPIFEVDVERRSWVIRHDDAEVELVLDRGHVVAGERRTAVCEIELELKEGRQTALFDLARRIDKECPVRLGVLTKSERGYALLDAASGAVKDRAVDLDPAVTAGQAFSRIAAACLRHYRRNEALLLDHYDPGALHQARVAIRRLRSALFLFKPMLAPERTASFQAELKWLAGVLGEARNLDVLVEGIGEEALRASLAQVQAEAHVRVGQWLQSARVRGLMIDLVEWLTLGTGHDPAVRDAPAARLAAWRLRKLRRRIAQGGDHMKKLSDGARHEVRKDAKKLRYASEFFAGLFDGKKQRRRQQHFVDVLEEMQDGLGALNDLVSAPAILAQYGLSAQSGSVRPGKRRKLLAASADAHKLLKEAKAFWK
jgi:inorganic triphosphatase YgiF